MMDNLDSKILLLIAAYASKEIEQDELEQLQNWIDESPDNKKLFFDYIKMYRKSRQIGFYTYLNKEKAWDKIQSQLNRTLSLESKQKPSGIYKITNTYYKYAAAAAILLFVGFSFYFFQNNANKVKTTPAVVTTSVIKPGTDKATLVLGNGKTIILGQGNIYKGNGISANDKTISYTKANTKIEYNYLTIPRGGQFQLELADGTKVWLNSQSQLRFPNHFIEGKPRQLELVYGEAYFDVSPGTKHKGSHFNVKIKGQNIEVLGTQFNIKAYDDENKIYTTLVEGKVALSNNKQKVELMPNQQTVVNKQTNEIQTKWVDVYNDVAWKEGVFSFEDMPLKDIMKVLSRWYDVDVVFKSNKSESIRFTGVIDKNQKLEEIFKIINQTNSIPYEINQKTITLK